VNFYLLIQESLQQRDSSLTLRHYIELSKNNSHMSELQDKRRADHDRRLMIKLMELASPMTSFSFYYAAVNLPAQHLHIFHKNAELIGHNLNWTKIDRKNNFKVILKKKNYEVFDCWTWWLHWDQFNISIT